MLGALLVGAACILFFYNKWDAARAEKASAAVQEKLEEKLDEKPEETPVPIPEPEREMTAVTIDGWEYIGYVSIPALDLRLPVMNWWSEEGLKIAPGRFSGSVFTDDLVIAGHNYARHFSPIKWLDAGTEVDFTDMDNRIYRYQVSEIEELDPSQVTEMTEKTKEDPWDLTLFTCTTSGEKRCAVRCIRSE